MSLIEDAEAQLARREYSEALRSADRICAELRDELGAPGTSKVLHLDANTKSEKLELVRRAMAVASAVASSPDGRPARKAKESSRRLEAVRWEYSRTGQAAPSPSAGPSVAVERIEILTGRPERSFREIRQVQARASAPTAFTRAPNLDEVNGKLREEAAALGANAVIEVRYERGMDAFSWKVIRAAGIAVFMEPDAKQCPYCAETIKAAAIKCRFCGSDLP